MSDPEFLAVASQFQLGVLDTERPHPKTAHLSDWATNDLPRAIEALRSVDENAVNLLEDRLPVLEPMARAIRATIDRGNRVFLCGCGATGRLSISVEIFARRGLLPGANESNVVGFMAGGDAALIRSIERFEDRPDFGERQLRELGFAEGDLLIASTEGGETPFVIGATEAAAKISSELPFFLYCNPDVELIKHVERSRKVIENSGIRKINLAVGPMALSGSTRMQASTVLMAAIGWAMKFGENSERMASDFQGWREWAIETVDWSGLEAFIVAEANTYQAGEFVLYDPGPYGITVLTDTTERSPTFTLTPFERVGQQEPPSNCYLQIPSAETPEEAWLQLLGRPARPLEWGELSHLTNVDALQKFDFSSQGIEDRERRLKGVKQHLFQISRSGHEIEWRFQDLHWKIPVPEEIDFLGENLLLKLLLNTHSTLVMGRLGRYADNVMTFVSANNFKLIDRSIRYVRLLLKNRHAIDSDYYEVATVLLNQKESLQPNEAIVLKTVDAILRNADAGI